MRYPLTLISLLLAVLAAAPAWAQYNRTAGKSAPAATVESVRVVDRESGDVRFEERQVEVKEDSYGNAAGSQYDLAVDGAFVGQTIVVVQLFNFDFSRPKAALEKKGFSVYRFTGAPEPAELEKALKKANQFWLVSDCYGQRLDKRHVKVIQKFFDAGHGVYIWGDNDPCYADANFVASRMFDTKMEGDLPGDQVVTFRTKYNQSGLLQDHLLSTGVENMYEGVTIATIQENDVLTPFLWGSAGNLVAAFYDRNGKRAILDGGFTRLYYKWDTAGTDRYVTNAAAWLANYERFGDAVVAEQFKAPKNETPVKR